MHRFRPLRWINRVDRSPESTSPAVLLPERFRAGCAFGGPVCGLSPSGDFVEGTLYTNPDSCTTMRSFDGVRAHFL